MRAVRILYKKYGHAKYISHLDLYRCIARAVRRAGIPLWYTEGFNPRPYLNILLALPLGQEALAEPMDMRIEGEMSDEEIKDKLNSVMPEGIEIVGIGQAQDTANDIAFASYDITMTFDNDNSALSFAGGAEKLIESGTLFAEKSGKKGGRKVLKQINLCDNIARFYSEAINNTVRIEAVLSAGNTVNLNPDLLVATLGDALNIVIEQTAIIREFFLKDDFSAFI